MTKHFTPRRVVKPGTPGIKVLLTTTSVAATLAGWALFATHEPPTEMLPAQQAVEAPLPQQAFAINVPAFPPIESLPTLVPPPPNMAKLGVAAQVRQPAQLPTAVQANMQDAPQVPQAPSQSLRTVNPPPVASRKSVPMATTRSSR